MGFYKTYIRWWYDAFPESENSDERYMTGGESFGFSVYKKWKRWEESFYPDSLFHPTDIVVKPRNGYYVAKFSLDGDKYKVYFGYGVDLSFYKKTRRVNYYRSPEFYIVKLTYNVKRLTYTVKRKIKRFFTR